MNEYTTKELCEEKHRRVEDKLDFIGSMCKAIFGAFVLEVLVLGFCVIKGILLT